MRIEFLGIEILGFELRPHLLIGISAMLYGGICLFANVTGITLDFPVFGNLYAVLLMLGGVITTLWERIFRHCR